MLALSQYTVATNYGQISICDSKNDGPVALLIHGNSACKEIFEKQFQDPASRKFRLIAMDLPGHGKSENARDPVGTYSLPGYADVAIAVLKNLGIQKASIVGWSLGGHVAIDMLKKWDGVQGILITGTPPIPMTGEGFKQGFLPFPCIHLMSQEKFSREEANTFVSQGGIDTTKASYMIDAALRTDGKARANLIASMQKGVGGNQKEIVEASDKPVAIIAGQADAGINNEYIEKEISKKTLWQKKVHVIDGGHGVFWDNAQKFNQVMFNFLEDINKKSPSTNNSSRKWVIASSVALLVLVIANLFFKYRNGLVSK